MSLSIQRARELLRRFARRRVLVVGDLMLDRYVTGSVDRLSPEAPVPVVRVRREHEAPGGASNVALNIRALGGAATVCGVLGGDAEGRRLRRLLKRQRVGLSVATRAGLPTTVKTRIVAERQQVVRVDREAPLEMEGPVLRAVLARLRAEAARSDALVIEDYGKGVIVQPVVDAALEAAAERDLPCGLDPKDNEELTVRGITFATPNRREAFAGAGLKDPGAGPDPLRDRALLRAGAALLERWAPRHLIVTLGPLGMLLLEPGRAPAHVPTRAREVFDVSGAGDTVIGVCALALAAGAEFREAAEIANFAAGVVVAKMGTASCSPDELLAHMRGGEGPA